VLDAGREYDDSRQHNVVYNVHVFLCQHVARLSRDLYATSLYVHVIQA